MSFTGPPPSAAQNELPVDSKVNQFLNKQLTDISQDMEYNIKSSRIDPQGPLYSGKTFTSLRLKPELLKALGELGFIQPSKIQEMILPVLLMAPPQNVIAQAQSGTGKTVAFVLAMLSRVDPTKPWPQCICLAPTFELALQIGDVIRELGKHVLGLTWKYAIKGAQLQHGTKITEHIIIGTPGKTYDWIIKFKALDPSKIVAFVLDEADQMISMQGIMEQSIRLHQ
uniref:ATP-dependent RNA helicase n=1 Tax=Steinernema glaseri TaxID=37863 RepID=A0A1I8AM04_9BILA